MCVTITSKFSRFDFKWKKLIKPPAFLSKKKKKLGRLLTPCSQLHPWAPLSKWGDKLRASLFISLAISPQAGKSLRVRPVLASIEQSYLILHRWEPVSERTPSVWHSKHSQGLLSKSSLPNNLLSCWPSIVPQNAVLGSFNIKISYRCKIHIKCSTF